MSQFFYAHDKRKIGPVSVSHLRLLLDSGHLRATDLVLRDGSKQWVTIASVFERDDFGPALPSRMSFTCERLWHWEIPLFPFSRMGASIG